MTAIFFASTSSLVNATLPLLADATAKGTLLLAVAMLLAVAIRSSSADQRHMLWAMALAALAALPLFTAVLPGWQVVPEWATSWRAARPLDNMPGDSTLEPSEAAATIKPGHGESPIVISEADRSSSYQPGIPTWQTLLVVLWGVGTSLLLLRLLLSRLVLYQVTRSAAKPAAELKQLAEQACQQLQLKRIPKIYVTDRRSMPMSWGILSGFVLLPKEIYQWERPRLEAVLLHELGHIKRNDTSVHALLRVTTAAWWFHPLVWLAVRRLSIEREHACDNLVLQSGVKPSDYAENLASILMDFLSHVPSTAVGMANPSHLETRIMAILDSNNSRKRVAKKTLALLACVTFGTTAAVATLQAADTNATVSQYQEKDHPGNTVKPKSPAKPKTQFNNLRIPKFHLNRDEIKTLEQLYASQYSHGQKLGKCTDCHVSTKADHPVFDLHAKLLKTKCTSCHQFNNKKDAKILHFHQWIGPDLKPTANQNKRIQELQAMIDDLQQRAVVNRAKQVETARILAERRAAKALQERIKRVESLVLPLLAKEGKAELILEYHAADPILYRSTELKILEQRLKRVENMLKTLQRKPIGSSLKDWGRKDKRK